VGAYLSKPLRYKHCVSIHLGNGRCITQSGIPDKNLISFSVRSDNSIVTRGLTAIRTVRSRRKHDSACRVGAQARGVPGGVEVLPVIHHTDRLPASTSFSSIGWAYGPPILNCERHCTVTQVKAGEVESPSPTEVSITRPVS